MSNLSRHRPGPIEFDGYCDVGVGNFTSASLFVDYAGGNLRLQSNSPCINARSAPVPGNTTYESRRPAGQPGTTSFTDTNVASPVLLFYRVGVGTEK